MLPVAPNSLLRTLTWTLVCLCTIGRANATYVTEAADLRMIANTVAQANNGRSVTNLGDVDGDGFLDFGYGVPGEDLGGTAIGAGAFAIMTGNGTADRPGANGFSRVFGIQAGENLGFSLSGAGDLNGDGLDDFLVGAPNWDDGAVADVGRVYVYFGRSGNSPVIAGELRGTQADARFGTAVAGAGDINLDGFADVLVGSPLFDDAGRVNSGQVQVFFGGSGGVFNTAPDATLAPTAANSLFGASLAGGGDVNGDGFSDFVVGVPQASVGQTGEGAGLLYFGNLGPLDTNADLAFESNQIGASMGISVTISGDVNGDGFSDVALGVPFYDNGQTNEGAVFVFHGGTTPNNTVDSVIELNVAGATAGSAVAYGDTNGDGFADLAIGSPTATDFGIAEFGRVHIVTGSATGLGAETFPISGLSSTTTAGRFGTALAFVDYNANGYPELFVGAPEESGGAGRPAQGFPYMVRTAMRLSATVDDTHDGTQGGSQFGHAIATGDINGDGLADLAVGLPNFDTGSQNVGRVELYYGTSGGFDATPDAVLNGGTAGARFGRSVAIGDFNRDGYGDLAVGAPEQTSNGGEAHVFYGGPGAFNVTVDRVLSIAQTGAAYGDVVANVGDLNGDGIVELAVGAPMADIGATNVGVAYLYFGSSSGIAAAPTHELQGGAVELRLGWSIAAAGDVNGDGFGDLAVGARSGSVEPGSTRIWFGGATFDTVADQNLTSGATSARCSAGLAGAGDVNGDGFSDLIVGCPGEFGSVTNSGAIRFYRGSSSGLIDASPTFISGTATGSEFGQSVHGGADIDGDGFSDVLIGIPGISSGGQTTNGALQWIRGGTSGLVLASATTISVAENSARLGSSAVLADLNGDGFADIIGGAPGVAGTGADVGAIHVVFANSEGRNTSPQQFRNPVAPFDFGGVTESPNGFFVAADAQSPRGREKTRLQVQLCPNAIPFADASCRSHITTTWQDVGNTPAGTVVVSAPDDLVSATSYRWRSRLVYAPMGIDLTGITAPANPARVGPWKRMRARADVGDVRTLTDNLFANGFE